MGSLEQVYGPPERRRKKKDPALSGIVGTTIVGSQGMNPLFKAPKITKRESKG